MRATKLSDKMDELISFLRKQKVPASKITKVGMTVRIKSTRDDIVDSLCEFADLKKPTDPNWTNINNISNCVSVISRNSDELLVHFYDWVLFATTAGEIVNHLLEEFVKIRDLDETFVNGTHVKILDKSLNKPEDLFVYMYTSFSLVGEDLEEYEENLKLGILRVFSVRARNTMFKAFKNNIDIKGKTATMITGGSMLIVPIGLKPEEAMNIIRDLLGYDKDPNILVMKVLEDRLGFFRLCIVYDKESNYIWLHTVNTLESIEYSKQKVKQGAAQKLRPTINGYIMDKDNRIVDCIPYDRLMEPAETTKRVRIDFKEFT